MPIKYIIIQVPLSCASGFRTAHKKKDTIHQILYNSFYSTMHIASARGEIQRKGRLSQFLGHAWPITADGRGLAKG